MCTTSEVGMLEACASSVTGYSGVYDLSGNVWEWEDSCDGYVGSNDYCRVRGGSFNYFENALKCYYGIIVGGRDWQGYVFGFRCCSSP